MDNYIGNICVKIHIEFKDHVTSDFLVNTVTSIDRAIFKQEKLLLKTLRKEFSDLPTVFFDAAEFRLQNNKGKALQIKSAEEGSIILIGMAFGLSYWILKQTLGETVKEAWLESDSHKKLKKYLKADLISKSKNIENEIMLELNKKDIVSEIGRTCNKEDVEIVIYVYNKDEIGTND